MRTREDRQKFMIRARMRSGVSWNDVCILDLSGRGIGIQAALPPSRGTIVEICRGSQIVVARVIWTHGRRAGLRSQDTIFVSAFVNEATSAKACSPSTEGDPSERRTAPRRAQQRNEHSRVAGRAFEFICLALFAGALSIAVYRSVQSALAQPFSAISAELE